MQKNDFLRISFDTKIKESGQQLDSSENVPVIVAEGYSLKGVEEQLLIINVGQKKEFEVVPEKAFGKRDPSLIKLVSMNEFRKHNTKPVPGMIVEADNRRARVLSVSGGRVRVDFNHPLAGKTLVYNLEVKEMIETPEQKIKAIVEIFTRIKNNVDVKIVENTADIKVPPMINSLIKKRIADESMRFIELEKVTFLEVFEKPKEQKTEEKKPEEKL